MNAKLEKTLLCAFRLISIMKLPLQACMFVAFTLFLEKKAFFQLCFGSCSASGHVMSLIGRS